MAEPVKIKIVLSLKQSIKASFPFFLIALLLLACRKEEPIFPGLNLERQNLKSLYDYQDTMRLFFRATKANSYQINLLQGAQVFPIEQRLIYKDGDEYEVELYFNDPYFPTGSYDVRIQAFNGEEGVSTFYSFSYRELALGYEDYMLLGASKLTKVDFYDQTRVDYPLPAEYDQIVVSSRDSLVFLAAYKDEKLAVYDLKDLSPITDFPLPAPTGSKSYNSFVKTHRGLYALQTDGEIKHYQGTSVLATISVNAGRGEQARNGAWLGNRLAAVVSAAGGSNPELIIFNANLNGIFSTYPLSDPNAYLVKISEDKVGVFEKVNSQLKFSTYTISSKVFNLEFTANIEAIRAAAYAFTSPDVYRLIFANDSGYYSYELAGSNPPQFNQNLTLKNLTLDRLNEILLVQNDNAVQTYVSPGNLNFAASFFGELKDFDILYTK